MNTPLIKAALQSRRRDKKLPPGSGEDAAPAEPVAEAGPLEVIHVARSDIEGAPEWAEGSIESLPELEREIGMADWIDPQTGEPAEGQSPPHLEAE